MSNQIQKTPNLNQYLDLPAVSGRLSEKLGLEEAKKFKAALSSAVSTNPTLMTECDPATVVNGALIGHALNLPPSPQLGYYYLVPYKNKKKNCSDATFIMGYKGYIQLAMRSGYYKKLNVLAIKKSEFVSYDPLTEELKTNFITDPEEREAAETVGYTGFFEYINGFTKLIYWTKHQMEVHADKYSPAFSMDDYKKLQAGKIPPKDLWKFSSFWYKDFDMMARKTMIRQLLGKWGAMSVEMQTAFHEDEKLSYAEKAEQTHKELKAAAGKEITDVKFEEAPPADEADRGEAELAKADLQADFLND